TNDSQGLYFTAEDEGEIPIYFLGTGKSLLNNNGNPVVPLEVQEMTRGANDELEVSPDGKTLVFTRMSIRAPNEIYTANLGMFHSLNSLIGAKIEKNAAISNRKEYKAGRLAPQQLTHLNDAVLSQVVMQPVESFWFTGAEGAKVQGFLVKPPGLDPQKKY